MQVTVIVFLFLLRVWFLKSEFITRVIRARYNENTIKRIQKLEKLDYHLLKAELDLKFLCKSDDKNVVVKFLILCAQKHPPEVFYEKDVFENFAKFKEKHQYQSLLFNKVLIRHRCFPLNFAKFPRTPFLQNSLDSCFFAQQIVTWNVLLYVSNVNQVYWEKKFVRKNLQYETCRKNLDLSKHLIWLILPMSVFWKCLVQQKKFYKPVRESKTANVPEKIVFLSINYLKLKRSSSRKVSTLVLHLNRWIMLTNWVTFEFFFWNIRDLEVFLMGTYIFWRQN